VADRGERSRPLHNDVPPVSETIFLALGVDEVFQTRSSWLILRFALLTFEFGNRFVVNLMGRLDGKWLPTSRKKARPLYAGWRRVS
jgi:hypothetical protein